jgi:hypothetical protein
MLRPSHTRLLSPAGCGAAVGLLGAVSPRAAAMRSRTLRSVVALALWQGWACYPRSDRETREHARRLVAELEGRTVPPNISSMAARDTTGQPCVIGRGWSFTTPQGPVEYAQWLGRQLSPDFRSLSADSGRLVFSRYDGADAQSVSVETVDAPTGLVVHVSLCVFPD